MSRIFPAALTILAVSIPSLASAQINFEKTGYYAAMGDSVAAGEGAMPVTKGYAYQLYEQGVFGQKQHMDFANLSVRGGRSWEFRDHQVSELLCSEPAQRPTVVTITVGANDFLRGDTNIAGIASRVVEGIKILLYNGTPAVSSPVIDPRSQTACRPLTNVTILVSNYISIPHPVPVVNAQLDAALRGFDQALRLFLGFLPVPAGSHVAVVDVFTPSLDQQGLLLIDKRNGYTGPFDFEVHPTNAGHSFIARQFEEAWKQIQ
ncbi:MAG: SGNH/GDSL hydrolase family protein [Vicinamibacterales bacterium]